MHPRLLQLPLAAAVVAATAGPSWALAPGKHRAILEAACSEAGLPYELCRRAGRADYETDYREWNSLAAHAQRERGQDRCPAADAAQARLDQLGRSIVESAAVADYERVADDLGRAIHTLQDECAHHGMTNPEHAFYSMKQTCSSGEHSPDVQPEAIACATSRTREAMWFVADALAGGNRAAMDSVCSIGLGGGGEGGDQDTTCATAVLPTPSMGCRFLAEHKNWDGVDSTWNGGIVGSELFDAFVAGLTGVPASTTVCRGDDHAIDPVSPRPDVTDREVGCLLTDIGCLGRADDPGEDGEPHDDGDDVGCQGGRGVGGLVVLVLLVGLIRSGALGRGRRSPAPR
jgi:hypothetical protein